MHRPYRTFALVVIAFSSLFIASSDARRGAGARAVERAAPLDCAGITTLVECPETGCGPGADLLLNSAKNRTDTASGATRMTVGQIARLGQPSRWADNTPRTGLQAPDGKEGKAVVLVGYLLKVKHGGKEACNCNLSGAANTDIHLAVGGRSYTIEASSVTAEVSPRIAAGHTGWSYATFRHLIGKKVRLTGWLMLDTKHISRPIVRASNWEVHPVTDVEYCPSGTCRSGGWVRLE